MCHPREPITPALDADTWPVGTIFSLSYEHLTTVILFSDMGCGWMEVSPPLIIGKSSEPGILALEGVRHQGQRVSTSPQTHWFAFTML